MTLRPAHAALLIVAIVFLGGVLGWWITRGALASGPRVELAAKIQSLPPAGELPSLASSTVSLADHFVSPGGPVWISLLPTGRSSETGTVCRFDRKTSGGVKRPRCKAVRELEHGSRFSVGGSDPALLLPPEQSSGKARALDAWTGKPREVREHSGLLSAAAPKGTRLVRQFRASRGELSMASPSEGVFVGPHAAHAIIEPPGSRGIEGARDFTCATPTGYVRARWKGAELTVSFSANTEESREVATQVPSLAGLEPHFACNTHQGSLTWLVTGGRLRRVRCDPSGCKHAQVALGDIASESVVMAAEVGPYTAVVYDRGERPMLRLGSFAELGHSPSAPLFGEASSQGTVRARDLDFVPTGTSLLVFLRAPELKVVQIHETGALETLRPE